MKHAPASGILLGCMIAASTAAQQPDVHELTPWLDVPAAWSRTVENDVVAVSPDDLPLGAQLLLLVEPATKSHESLAVAYAQALRDLGPWRAVGEPVEQRFDNGWVFRMGVGVATLEGKNYTAQTAVAHSGDLRVRFWALADLDDTFNRYKNAVGTAIASAQDISHPPAIATAPSGSPVKAAALKTHKPDTAFGKGISGVYVGIERGLSASAGVGSGPQQVFNQSTGRYETSNTGTAPAVQTQISDYAEVDVFYPDGTYRRRLPVRGLASDPNWERRQQKDLWGTWQRNGNKIIVRRGAYTTSYTVENDNTLISDRGRPWARIAPSSGKRLDGMYARADYRDAVAPRLVLRADGSYEDRGDFLRMIGSATNLVAPDGDAMLARWSDAEARRALAGDSGTYTYENFTLTLRDRDGRVWQLNAYVPPGEALPRPRRLVINGRALVRD
ncbi:MAG: hypothetical protein NUV55_11400 [Sulfuricaulis sp.]|uniref:hypothetical protein n=1 Tax=Sulfuricaulis sp. TaxID=2003553 RepID=UPI0025FE1585|nr:hypothetical protein [Sulfuricaulis sp.]MCR4347789.1 hypothetical protein [Sulfuricaulis sp.]